MKEDRLIRNGTPYWLFASGAGDDRLGVSSLSSAHEKVRAILAFAQALTNLIVMKQISGTT